MSEPSVSRKRKPVVSAAGRWRSRHHGPRTADVSRIEEGDGDGVPCMSRVGGIDLLLEQCRIQPVARCSARCQLAARSGAIVWAHPRFEGFRAGMIRRMGVRTDHQHRLQQAITHSAGDPAINGPRRREGVHEALQHDCASTRAIASAAHLSSGVVFTGLHPTGPHREAAAAWTPEHRP